MSTLRPVAILLGSQLVGELVTRYFMVPLPGAVVGCGLLLSVLLITGRMPAGLKVTTETLLRYLPIMFVPAGVGVMADAEQLRDEWLLLLLALMLSTAVTITTTAWIFGVVARRVPQQTRTDHDSP